MPSVSNTSLLHSLGDALDDTQGIVCGWFLIAWNEQGWLSNRTDILGEFLAPLGCTPMERNV